MKKKNLLLEKLKMALNRSESMCKGTGASGEPDACLGCDGSECMSGRVGNGDEQGRKGP